MGSAYGTTMKRICMFVLLVALLQNPACASSAINVDEPAYEFPDPVSVDDGPVNFRVNVSDKEEADEINNTYLFIIVNSTVTEQVYATSNISYASYNITEFNFSYDPSSAQRYTYYFEAYDNTVPTPHYDRSQNFTFNAYVYPHVAECYDDGPVKYDNGTITIWCSVDIWSNPLDSAVLNMTSPESATVYNSSSALIDADTYNVSFTYDPSQIAIYEFNIFVNDTMIYNSTSAAYSFESEGYPPEINSLTRFMTSIKKWENISWENLIFEANVTDPKDDITEIILELYTPADGTYMLSMNKTANDTYVTNWTINTTGVYIYRLYVNDSEGNAVYSSYYNIRSVIMGDGDATVRAQVTPTCCIGYHHFPVPAEIEINEWVLFSATVENCGSVPLNLSYMTMYIQKKEILSAFDQSLVIEDGTNIIERFENSSLPSIDPSDHYTYYVAWYSGNYILADCNITVETNYVSKYKQNGTLYCDDMINTTKDFEVISLFKGDKTPSDSGGEHAPSIVMPVETVKIILTSLNESYQAYQDQFIPVYFDITNKGSSGVKNITIMADISEEFAGWNITTALVSYLGAGDTVKRTLLFKPPKDATPGGYVIPVKAYILDTVADLEYIMIEVFLGIFNAKLKIIESPDVMELKHNSDVRIPVRIKNIGEADLHNITMDIENAESCIGSYESERVSLDVNETKFIRIYTKSKNGPERCEASIIISSAEEAYAFAKITLIVMPAPALLPEGFGSMFGNMTTALLALAWTFTLVSYVALRRRRKKRCMELHEKIGKPNALVYFMLLGETLIVIYLIFTFIFTFVIR
ncbi:MAG: hypothetical protein U9O53_00970 [archaeon]|nr:hypothetical protein [archaeon]